MYYLYRLTVINLTSSEVGIGVIEGDEEEQVGINLRENETRVFTSLTPFQTSELEYLKNKRLITYLLEEPTVSGNVHIGPLPPLFPPIGFEWYNTTEKIWYTWDGTDWLSNEKITLNFARDGNADGTYLRVGEVKSSSAGHHIPKNARLVYLSAYATSGFATKGFEILKIGSLIPLFSFNLSSLKYSNTTISVNLNAGDVLQCLCVSAGSFVTDPVVDATICWRY